MLALEILRDTQNIITAHDCACKLPIIKQKKKDIIKVSIISARIFYYSIN